MDDKLLTRTMRVPIADVVEIVDDEPSTPGGKSEFYASLRDSLRRATAAANAAFSAAAAADVGAQLALAAGEKVPRCPKLDLYAVVRGCFPGEMYTGAMIVRAVESVYRRYRFEILTGRRSLPWQRSFPLPLAHNKSRANISLWIAEDGSTVAEFETLDHRRWRATIRGGSNYRRPLRTIRDCVVRGYEWIGDSKIWIDRRGVAVLGIACRVAPAVDRRRSGTLRIATARDCFVCCVREKSDTPFVINADHVRGWIAARARTIQRLSQDRKAGLRRGAIRDRTAVVSRKYEDRLRSFVEQTTAAVIKHAVRRRFAAIEYDGTIRSYFGPSFPWAAFESRLRDKATEAGLTLESVTREITPADESEPHVYFLTPIVDGRINGRVKIGQTAASGGSRRRALTAAGGAELLVLATHRVAKSNLRKQERAYHQQFAADRIEGQREWFRAGPVIDWLRTVGALGNAGNRSQIAQYIEE